MFFFLDPSIADSSTRTLNQDTLQNSCSERVMISLEGLRRLDYAGGIFDYLLGENREGVKELVISDCVRGLLLDHSYPNKMVGISSHTETTGYIASPFRATDILTVTEVCNVLRSWGKDTLADRIAYFASDEDLDEGDESLSLQSARCFLAFLREVESDVEIGLTCSQEGWLCAEWRFTDQRRASLWFIDDDKVMVAAKDSSGKVIRMDDYDEIGDRSRVIARLVQAGILEWSLHKLLNADFDPTRTWRGTAAPGILTNLIDRPPMLSGLEQTRNTTYPPTGSSTSISPTAPYNYRQFVSL